MQDDIEIVLFENADATVSGVPLGTSIVDGNGNYCVTGFQGASYSGNATWEPTSEYTFEVRYHDAALVLFSETLYFGGADWTEIRFTTCDGQSRWDLGHVCGDFGDGPRESPANRDTCPVVD
ncbi:hypothetical protein [Agromyces mangrovi Wang et al. 2018]|uniref:hypothetical protein n=1 Tax=Agromyces mangrovi TaxID=1858653 RepID=UPI00257283A4|nr:hypothetical protein [Agromyces mangrovi]BDZ63929.1 hypothetical protein GCM10025877_08670 [Agromyces mangrovi]